MACLIELSQEKQHWLEERPVAAAIINEGINDIGGDAQSTKHNVLVALLENMSTYGQAHWRYEPDNTAHADNTLKGLHEVTDCESLAQMLTLLAEALGYAGARPRKIENPGFRLVTVADLPCFTGATGDEQLEGRWCFGDHWVMEYESKKYDPTFVVTNNSGDTSPAFDWWALEERGPFNVFTNSIWTANGKPTVYIGQIEGTPSRAAVPGREPRTYLCGLICIAARPAQAAVEAAPGRFFYTFRETNEVGREVD